MTEEIVNWFRQALGITQLTPEYLAPEDGAAGLFCRGREVVWQRRDICGCQIRRLRLTLLLAMHTAKAPDMDLAEQIDDALQRFAPTLGLDQTVRLEQARVVKQEGWGLVRTEARLTFEYTQKEEI